MFALVLDIVLFMLTRKPNERGKVKYACLAMQTVKTNFRVQLEIITVLI